MRSRRSGVAVGGALLVALWIGGAAGPVGATDAGPVTTTKVRAAGVALEWPRPWIVFARTKRGLAAQRKQLERSDPRLERAFEVELVAASDPTTRSYASDLGGVAGGGVASNVRVQVVPGGFPSDLAAFVAARAPSVETIGGTVLNASTVEVAGETGYRLDVSLPVPKPDGTVVRTRLGQLLVRRGAGRVVITVGSSDDDAGSALIDRVLRSVRRI